MDIKEKRLIELVEKLLPAQMLYDLYGKGRLRAWGDEDNVMYVTRAGTIYDIHTYIKDSVQEFSYQGVVELDYYVSDGQGYQITIFTTDTNYSAVFKPYDLMEVADYQEDVLAKLLQLFTSYRPEMVDTFFKENEQKLDRAMYVRLKQSLMTK